MRPEFRKPKTRPLPRDLQTYHISLFEALGIDFVGALFNLYREMCI